MKKNLDETSTDSQNKVAELGTKITGLQQQLTTAESDLSAMEDNHYDCTGREKDCKDSKEELNTRIEKLIGEIKAATETRESMDEQINTLTSESGDAV